MRNDIPSGFNDQTRSISASLSVVKNRPNFEYMQVAYEILGGSYTELLAYDAKYVAGTGYLRACLARDVVLGDIALFTNLLPNPTDENRWWTLRYTLTSGQRYNYPQELAGHAYSVAVMGDGMVLVGCHGQPLYMNTSYAVNTTSFPSGTTDEIGTFPVVGGGTSTIYAGYPNTNPGDFQFMELCAIYKTTNPLWPNVISYESIDNYVQRVTTKVKMAVGGDCTVNKRELVFFDNPAVKRIQFFAGYKIDAYAAYTQFVRDYGAIEDVLPMDTYDDEDQIKLVNVDMLGSRPVLTAKLKRRNGGEYLTYLIGPDLNDPFSPNTFSIGRDMIIDAVDLTREQNLSANTDHGGLWFHSSGAHFIGWGCRYTAQPTTFFGSTVTPVEAQFSRADLSLSTNQPHVLQATLRSSDIGKVEAGDELLLKVAEEGQDVEVLRFGVDQVSQTLSGSGRQDQVMASSLSLKKLAQWQNDAALDYLSQETATGDLKDLTRFIRKEGRWDTNDTGLYLKDLNVRGVLYSAIPASERAFIRAHFKVENPQHAIELGVGLHYIEENVKSQRVINGFTSEVTQNMRSGVFFILRRNQGGAIDAANSGFYYYDSTFMVQDGPTQQYWPDVPQPWTPLGSLSTTPNAITSAEFDLFMYANDGVYNAYMIQPGSVTPTHLAYCDLPRTIQYSRRGFRNEKDNYGRGAIYARNITYTGQIYPMGSDSTAIGLYGPYEIDKYGHDAFPASETVIIDSEQIPYTTREISKTYFGKADFTYGPVVTHNLLSSGTLLTFASKRGTAGDPGDNYAIQEIVGLLATTYLRAVKV